MHVRVSTCAGPPDGVDDGIRNFEGMTDSLLQLDGFQGAYLLVDRSAGRAMTITLWSSEEAAEASAERASQMRHEAAGGAGLTTESVDTYEVAVGVEPGG